MPLRLKATILSRVIFSSVLLAFVMSACEAAKDPTDHGVVLVALSRPKAEIDEIPAGLVRGAVKGFVGSIRRLGVWDGWQYYGGVNDASGDVCFLAIPFPENDTVAMSCSDPKLFSKKAITLHVDMTGRIMEAYLMPDGYATTTVLQNTYLVAANVLSSSIEPAHAEDVYVGSYVPGKPSVLVRRLGPMQLASPTA